MEIVYYVAAFLGFAILTSYFNVLIERGFKKSLFGRSHCDSCKKTLSPIYMVPILSSIYLILFHGSKTACCGKPFSKKYLITELLGGMGGILTLANILDANVGLTVALVFFLISLLFLYMAVEDVWHMEIDMVPLTGMLILLFTAAFAFPVEMRHMLGYYEANSLDAVFSGIAYALVVVILIFVSRGKGLGVGDIFVVFFIGASLGWTAAAVALQITIYSATIIGLLFAVYKKQFKGLIIPLVPFLFLGWLLGLLFAEMIVNSIYGRPYLL